MSPCLPGTMCSFCPYFIADMAELSLPPNISIAFPDGKEKTTHFEITIRPDEGIFKCVSLYLCLLLYKPCI